MMKTMKMPQIIALIVLILLVGCNEKRIETSVRDVKSIIIKDDYLLPAKEGDYMTVRHIALKGTNEEIGFALATIAKDEYGTSLARYTDTIYAQARLAYFQRNWPDMAERMKGVSKVFGEDIENTIYDASELMYDMPLGNMGCSAIFFPGSITESGHPLVVRNYDYFKITFSETQHKTPQPGEHRMNDRSVVIEINPTDGGYASLALGGMNLLNPFLDVMNEKGLFVTALVDPDAPVLKGNNLTGETTAGLSIFQLPQMLAAKCATVEEAKKELLAQHLVEVNKGLHWLIADAQGNAAVFEIDDKDGLVFTDAQPDQPLIVTNYHLYTYPEYKDFPKVNRSQEHNPFVRRYILDEAINKHSGKYTKEDVVEIIDQVLCSFVDDAKAGVNGGLPERTLWSHTADLTEKNMDVRFYQGDGLPIKGSNRLEMRRTQPIRVAFGESD